MKNNINILKNIGSKLYLVIIITLSIIFSFLVNKSININTTYLNDEVNPFILSIMSIIYIFLILKIKKVISKRIKNDKNTTALILILITFVLLIISAIIIQSVSHYDLGNVIPVAKQLAKNKKSIDFLYFEMFPNNLGVLYIVTFIYKIARFVKVGAYSLAYAASAFSICITLYFTYLSIKKISDKENALTFLIFLMLNPLFYLYVTYYYSDIFSMPFMSIIIYLLVNNAKYKQEKIGFKAILFYILIGLLSYIGYKVRATVIFILIAFVMAMFFTEKFKNTILKIIILVFGLSLGFAMNYPVEKSLNLDHNKKFPLTYWILMGINTENYGRWYRNDTNLTENAKTYEEKKEKNVSEIKNRIKNMTFHEYIKLLKEKNIYNWTSGDSKFNYYFVMTNNINKSYEYILGSKTIILSYILQTNRIVLYVLALASIIYELFNKKREINFIPITIFGAFMFYNLWEVHPRYVFSYIPTFTLMAAYNFNKISKLKFKKIELLNDEELVEIDRVKILKYFKIILLIITILGFILNYGYYTKNTKEYRDKAVYIVSWDADDKKINIDKSTSVKQTFKTSVKFDSVKFKIFKKDNPSGKLTLKLFDNNNKLLYSGLKDIATINNNSYVEYNFGKNYNTNGNLYYIEITTNVEKDKLELLGIYKKYYDYYSSGTLLVNDKDTKIDLQMNISNITNRSILSKKVYIFLMISAIGIELYSLELLPKKKKRH